jgi:SRSO17 transposase
MSNVFKRPSGSLVKLCNIDTKSGHGLPGTFRIFCIQLINHHPAINLQQFIIHSKWDARAVIYQVARDGNNLIGDQKQTGLLIDESAFAKQGKMSVGAARQRLGRVGKVDNGGSAF